MAVARCPGTCGELIQGLFNQQCGLVSAPIDWFAEVEITDRRFSSSQYLKPKMKLAAVSVCHLLDIDSSHLEKLKIVHRSTLPIAKGFASSTADIIATCLAISAHFNRKLTPQQLTTLASTIEPSDANALPFCALTDPTTGEILQHYQWQPDCDILILEREEVLDTAHAHQSLNWARHNTNFKSQFSALLMQFSQAIVDQDIQRLGEAATFSAEIHQHILPKPLFHQLASLVGNDVHGINIAHTGTIVGLLYNAQNTDINSVLGKLNQTALNQYYPKRHCHRLCFSGSSIG